MGLKLSLEENEALEGMLAVVVDKGVENLKLSLEVIDVDATEAPNNKK